MVKLKVWSWRSAIQQSSLQSTTKLVLLNLSIHMNDLGESCYPSIKRQSDDTGLSERAICTHLEIALNNGFIKIKKHGFSGRGWARNEYFASYPEGTELRSCSCDKALNDVQEGTERDDSKALNYVQSNSSSNSSVNSEEPHDKIFDEEEVKKAHKGQEAYSPKLIDSDVLPAGWQDYAEDNKINDEQIFKLWTKFKDKTKSPRDFNRWKNWVNREKSYDG